MASSSSEPKQPTRALVLGGGGPVGRAWEAGLVSGLVAKSIELRSADLILGTSAGAIIGAQLALNLDLTPAPPTGQVPPPAAVTPASANGMAALIRATALASRAPAPEPYRQSIGIIALGAATPSEEFSIKRIDVPADKGWPANFRATAVNVRTGESIVWQASSGVPLDHAVASSCALPGVWPPITINGERYMDGGIRSMLNADLASGYTAVLVVSCFALALPGESKNEDQDTLNAKLNADIAGLRASGSHVNVIMPSERFLELTQGGMRMLDAALAPEAYKLGIQQAHVEADRVDPLWHQG